jgi:peptidoglycan/xylan/chitin deacetylase (PgdA/CDA1 family)
MNRILIVLVLCVIMFGCNYTSKAPQKDIVVSINFDDGNERVFTEALPIMEQYGFRGTVFINSDRVGARNKLTWSQIDSLKNVYHWEIGGHTPKHEDLNLLTYEQADSVIYKDLMTIKNHGIKAESFATPFGHCPVE